MLLGARAAPHVDLGRTAGHTWNVCPLTIPVFHLYELYAEKEVNKVKSKNIKIRAGKGERGSLELSTFLVLLGMPWVQNSRHSQERPSTRATCYSRRTQLLSESQVPEWCLADSSCSINTRQIKE